MGKVHVELTTEEAHNIQGYPLYLHTCILEMHMPELLHNTHRHIQTKTISYFFNFLRQGLTQMPIWHIKKV